MSNLFIMQKAALYAGDENPTNAHHLDLTSVKLPMLQENSTDHKPGGGIMGIKIGMGQVEALTVSMKMKGLTPDLMGHFGISAPRARKYTIRGSILNVRDGAEIPGVAVVKGRILKADLSEFSVDNGIDADYEIHEIDFYELVIGGQEKYHLDLWRGPLGYRVDGVPVHDVTARNLGLV